MTIEYHEKFLKDFQKLPKSIQSKLVDLEEIFKTNPFHLTLRTKKLSGKLKTTYSFRINPKYRVLFEFTENSKVLFLFVGHRKDVYEK